MIDFSKINRELNRQKNSIASLTKGCIDSSPFSEFSYNHAKTPKMYFLKEFQIGAVKYLRGDEYPVYSYDWGQMIDLRNENIITEEKPNP